MGGSSILVGDRGAPGPLKETENEKERICRDRE